MIKPLYSQPTGRQCSIHVPHTCMKSVLLHTIKCCPQQQVNVFSPTHKASDECCHENRNKLWCSFYHSPNDSWILLNRQYITKPTCFILSHHSGRHSKKGHIWHPTFIVHWKYVWRCLPYTVYWVETHYLLRFMLEYQPANTCLDRHLFHISITQVLAWLGWPLPFLC